ncbi:MAG TPA: hypothetical protein EYG52_20140 [Pseudomonadales bacterium]|jgi:hypothetical protein|nr:hypothetical protein [Gammaproteobacteria bacterium]HIL85809.1 hypothetical protein [Pseudomonadales bacterium]
MTRQKPHNKTRRLILRLIPVALVALAISIVWHSSIKQAKEYVYLQDNYDHLEESIVPQMPLEDIRDDQAVIYFGIHVDKIYELSLHSRTFSADGSLWVEWDTENQKYMEKHSIAPHELLNLVNQIERWDSVFEPTTAEPLFLSAGRYYQRFRFSSRFYDDEINFRRDPFDSLILPIVVEVAPEVMSQKYHQTLLYPHHHQNGFLGMSGALSGYQLEGAILNSYIHQYPSRFGEWYQPAFSQARLDIVYHSDYWSAFVNWLLPLIIVMSVVLLSPAVTGSMGDVRLAIPSTALLTLIFMQQAYHDNIPALPYLTFLDQLFACSYLIAMGLFALFTWGTNVYTKAPDDKKNETMERIDRVDVIFQISAVFAVATVAMLAWFATFS